MSISFRWLYRYQYRCFAKSFSDRRPDLVIAVVLVAVAVIDRGTAAEEKESPDRFSSCSPSFLFLDSLFLVFENEWD